MVLDVVFFGMTGLVLLLRLITKKLGAYLEMLADWKAAVLETMDGLLAHRQDRQEYSPTGS